MSSPMLASQAERTPPPLPEVTPHGEPRPFWGAVGREALRCHPGRWFGREEGGGCRPGPLSPSCSEEASSDDSEAS